MEGPLRGASEAQGLNLNLTFERISEPELHTAPGVWMIHYVGQAGEKPAQQTAAGRRLDDGGTAWSVADMSDGYWWAIHRDAGQRPGQGRKVWFRVESGAIVRAWRSQPSAVARIFDAQNERIQRELRRGSRGPVITTENATMRTTAEIEAGLRAQVQRQIDEQLRGGVW